MKLARFWCGFLCSVQAQEKVKLDMHVVTHSHLDAGWVRDISQCYQVTKSIFDSVVEELEKDVQKTYTIGDIYFFRRWYYDR